MSYGENGPRGDPTLVFATQYRIHEMSATVKSDLPPQVASSSGPSAQLQDDSKGKVLAFLKDRLNSVQLHYHEFLAELAYLQGGGLLTDFELWRRDRPQDLTHALLSGHLDAEDLAKISAFMVGNLTMHEMFPVHVDSSQTDDLDEDSEEDFERFVDESAIPVLVRKEVETLKRVLEFKRLGLWSRDAALLSGDDKQRSSDIKPSLSSLAPPLELTRPKDHLDYVFAEMRWLAEDFKKERHWKKVTARKLAYAALKVYKEKAERSLKAEREEVARTRKQCALIARMVRDWWRQMDKIVQTKQKARLTARHQQAMSTHLGHVIETTERYTMWLTEGITGTKQATNEQDISDKDTTQDEKAKEAESPSDSDAEFVADEVDSTDDEETIAREEEMARRDADSKEEESREVAALCAEAEASIDDLLPPGYLEHLQQLQETGKPGEGFLVEARDSELSPYDPQPLGKKSTRGVNSYEVAQTSTDDEMTVVENEIHEKTNCDGETNDDDDGPTAYEAKEVSELEAEADMSIEELLARYGLKSDQLNCWKEQGNVGHSSLSITNTSSTTGSASSSETSDNESSSEASSLQMEQENEDVSEEPGLKELLSDDEKENLSKNNSSMPDNPDLKAITYVAMSAQPQGNTLASVAKPVKTPFLLAGTLREYQVVGLSWLVAIYEKRLNGILADEMGLGKTIQTIALLAHLACELGIWGPHLIVVPNSVILNWEVEFKKWCPGFKILTYFGSAKERKAKRKGWTKTNAFHVCITSYRLAIQDSSAFKRKKWKYLILDEAQNIKNFKSQRWQTLLTFNSQRRLLLTGTPLQNSLMELWSLMHFLMPNIFQSHREFQEWFASPLTGMIEGNSEYNEQLVMRLHKVLRPFLLRRLKEDVERQMPKKYEHIILCRLSKRQRYLYDDFMSLSTTKETLASGQFLSVMNILMQLRKVCNHPNLFEPRPITSPFRMADDEVRLEVPRLLAQISQPLFFALHSGGGVPSAWTLACSLDWLDRAGAAARLLGQTVSLAEMARDLPSFVARRVHQLRANSKLISVVENSDPVDFVSRQREFFSNLKSRESLKGSESSNRRHPLPIFLPRSVVLEVNEELSKSVDGCQPPATKSKYPCLPRPTLKGTSYIPAQRRPNSWDTGVPKSVLRSRHVERQQRLSVLARVNERRCADPYCTPSFESTSMPTPDLVHLLTSLVIRQPVRRPTGFGTGAWIACQRSLRTWPDKRACDDADGPPTYFRHPTDVFSGLYAPSLQAAELERLQAFYGPEAAYPVRRASSKALRQMLFSPVDCLEYFSDNLDKFLITIPSVTSSGIRLHTSCANVHRNEMRQEEVFEATLQPFLKSAGVFKHCTVREKNSPPKIHCACGSLTFRSWLMPAHLHQVYNSHAFQFPDPRLIQYDCGKLQRLDLLLRELYADDHRVLIFTQMARMLDILEQFLAYHGYRYLRLDGATKVEQRQVLMERFNMDSRIFVFILSTRSGGLGINLTGADTVIFYDSDWNPTMDAQAQDRCHRIGQTRDVHIYRLISERTVEENILRKANQKRLLSDVAIEGGKFTTAFFKQSIISDLFAEPSGLHDLLQDKEERDAAKMKVANDFEETNKETQSPPSPPLLTTRSGRQIRWKGATSILLNAKQQISAGIASGQNAITDSQWVAALDACEDDENDRVAAKRALDEVKADLDEFDESKPIEVVVPGDGETKASVAEDVTPSIEGSTSDPLARFAKKRQQEALEANATDPSAVVSSDALTPEAMVEHELAEFESLLRPIERFGVNHLESFQDDTLNLELEQFEAQIEESKKEWKLNTLKALHEADEERAELEEDEILYCDPDYDPEAARLAELDELERAEEMELGMSGRGIRGRRGRGGSHFRGRGPRVRGGGGSTGRGATRRAENERFNLQSRDSDASSSTTNRYRIHQPSPENEEASVDRAVWFNVRHRENAGGRRRLTMPDYVDWDEDEDEDEPEATDIWSPGSSRRDFATASAASFTTPPPPKRSRGRGRARSGSGRGVIPIRGRRQPSECWGREESDEFAYTKRRRRLSSSLLEDEIEDSPPGSMRSDSLVSFEGYTPRPRQPDRPLSSFFQPIRHMGHESPRPARMKPNIIRPPNPRKYYHPYDTAYSLATPTVPYTSSFTGPIGVSSRGTSCHQTGSTGMLQHNSRVLNSLMQTAAEPLLENSPIFKHPPLPSREEEVSSRYQPINTSYRPRVRSHTPRHRLALDTQPRIPTFFRPTVGIPMRSANIAPPRQYHSPLPQATKAVQEEPTVSVQTLSNGVHSVQPLRQVLGGSSSQPVFVITRHLKTPSGEVYQQRITQPVQPPTKYVQVVRRVSQVPSAAQSQSVIPSTQRPVIRLASPATHVATAPSSTNANPTSATVINNAAPSVLPGRKIIRVVRSAAPNAIRILPPRIPP